MRLQSCWRRNRRGDKLLLQLEEAGFALRVVAQQQQQQQPELSHCHASTRASFPLLLLLHLYLAMQKTRLCRCCCRCLHGVQHKLWCRTTCCCNNGRSDGHGATFWGRSCCRAAAGFLCFVFLRKSLIDERLRRRVLLLLLPRHARLPHNEAQSKLKLKLHCCIAFT